MTEREAIKEHIKECSHRIKTIKRLMKSNHDADMEKCNRNIKILITAIEALKKQIPRKPVHIGGDGIRYTDLYRCPNCGQGFSGTGIADYCYHCGQKLEE